MTFSVPSNPSPQLKAAIDYFDALASYQTDTLASVLSDEYTHVLTPSSLGYSLLDKKGFLDIIEKRLWPLVKNLNFAHEQVVETADTIVVHSRSTESSIGIFTNTHYSNEYIFVLTLQKSSDGSYKVLRGLEFLDSHFIMTFLQAEGEAAEKAGVKLS